MIQGARATPLRSPYPPDLPDDAEPVTVFADPLVDAIVERADWANLRASGFAAKRVELRGCRLTGAELGGSVLTDATFADCRLDLVGLRFAKLERVVFRDCRMDECDLYGAALKDVLFERCELRRATFATVQAAGLELRGCDLEGLSGAEALRGARMPWPDVVANAGAFAAALGIEIVD